MNREPFEPSPYLNELSHNVVGAAIEVHRHLGPGFLEIAYERAMRLELTARGIGYTTQREIPIIYRDEQVATARLDLLIENELVVEIKSLESIHAIHAKQLLSYLRAGGFQLGLILNFNVPVLRDGVKRLVNSIYL